MNAYRKWTTGVLGAVLMVALAPAARAQIMDQRVRVTFHAPVEIPGKVLPAGTYVFEALEAGQVTRILSADETRIYGTLFTVPEERSRPVEDPTVVLEENVKGAPEKVGEWFSSGHLIGHAFMYPARGSHATLAAVAPTQAD